MQKLRAYYQFIAQRKHEKAYGIKRVRAILIETLDTSWAEELRQAAAQVCPLPLFWFTASEIFTRKKEVQDGNRPRKLPVFLFRPGIILDKVWVSAVGDRLQSLFD